MSIFSDIGGFISDNASWLKPLTSVATGLGAAYQTGSNQTDYINSLKAAEDNNYANAKAENDYENEVRAANASDSAARSSAAAGAANATDANRRAAAGKAFKVKDKADKQIEALYKPFADSDARILPGMEQAYMSSLGNLGQASQYFSSPAQMAKIGTSRPAYQIAIPVPKGFVGVH